MKKANRKAVNDMRPEYETLPVETFPRFPRAECHLRITPPN